MSDRERNFSVVEKTVRLRENIAEVLMTLIYDHQHKYNQLPKGLLVGPNEWLSLREHARGLQRFMDSGADGRVQSFHGIPVYPKCRPGVDLIPSEGIVGWLAHGIAKEK